MQPKKEYLFPEEVINEITSWLTPCDEKMTSSLTSVCRQYYALFQPKRLANKLLLCVANGNQDEAEKILKINPDIQTWKGNLIDSSGRKFENISPFEYILWALDVRYMGTMMLNCLPCNDEGENIRQKLFNQFQALEKNGITYINRAGEKINEKHFNFSPAIHSLQIYVNNFINWDKTAREKHWCMDYGLKQCDFPVHVRQHICDTEELFYGSVAFNNKTFKRTLEFHNFLTGKNEVWGLKVIPGLATLGVDYAIGGGRWSTTEEWFWGRVVAAVGTKVRSRLEAEGDLEALSALCRARNNDLANLGSRLEQQLEHQPVKCVIS